MPRFRIATWIVIAQISLLACKPGDSPNKPATESPPTPPPVAAPVVSTPGPIQIPPALQGAVPTEGFAPIVERLSAAVVNISSVKIVRVRARRPMMGNPFFYDLFGDGAPAPRARREQSLGSGVIVSEDGYILTNNHVVADADQVRVSLADKREYRAKIIGTDPKTDIAVIKIDGAKFAYAPFGDSTNVKVGDLSLAIGNPFGLGQTVTMGIISAVGRGNVGIVDYEDFI